MNFKDELFQSIQTMIEKSVANCKKDHTYQSVVKKVTPRGYVVLDESGNERTVPCCIPGLELKAMQRVWLKEPAGKLAELHICGVADNEIKKF